MFDYVVSLVKAFTNSLHQGHGEGPLERSVLIRSYITTAQYELNCKLYNHTIKRAQRIFLRYAQASTLTEHHSSILDYSLEVLQTIEGSSAALAWLEHFAV